MNKKAKVYHGQAEVDKYAKYDNTWDNVPVTNIKQIQEAYKEFMEDLMIESQEAY